MTLRLDDIPPDSSTPALIQNSAYSSASPPPDQSQVCPTAGLTPRPAIFNSHPMNQLQPLPPERVIQLLHEADTMDRPDRPGRQRDVFLVNIRNLFRVELRGVELTPTWPFTRLLLYQGEWMRGLCFPFNRPFQTIIALLCYSIEVPHCSSSFTLFILVVFRLLTRIEPFQPSSSLLIIACHPGSSLLSLCYMIPLSLP